MRFVAVIVLLLPQLLLADARKSWLDQSRQSPPFACIVGGKPFTPTDSQTEGGQIIWIDGASKLQARCAATVYPDFPVVEWTIHLKNTGESDSPMIEQLQAIDTTLHGDGFVLHHNTGSPYSPADYEPHITPLPAKSAKRITTSGGRSTNSDLPFFNIAFGKGGAIIGLGWPGQWAAEFRRDEKDSLRVIAGQELTHFRLRPGEEVRTPLVVMLTYEGDPGDAQNIWRRWMIVHNMPHPGGKPRRPWSARAAPISFTR